MSEMDREAGMVTPEILGRAMDAAWYGRGKYLGVSEGLEVTEEGEQCIDCLRYAYDPHQDVCLICGRGQLRPDSDDDYDDSLADVIPEDWCGEAMT